MLKSALPILLYIFFLPYIIKAQELSYTHYDSKDGLAGSTVYCMTLDKEGFLWFGTENGLSRYDGTHFKNFTTRDGLPDNEIIELFTDSKGRVWMAPFKKTVCFFYHGKLHTQENDSMLAKIKMVSNIYHFAEDRNGNILIDDFSRTRLYYISNDGNVTIIKSINGMPLTKVVILAGTKNSSFWILENGKVYGLSNGIFTENPAINILDYYYRQVLFSGSLLITRTFRNMQIRNMAYGKTLSIPFPATFLKYAVINDSLVGICKQFGIEIYNTENFTKSTYLEGKPVTGCIMDQEGSYWFTTLGMGIYRLNSAFVKNAIPTAKNNLKQIVSSIFKRNNKIVIGTKLSSLFDVDLKSNKVAFSNIIYMYTSESTSDMIDFRGLDNGDDIFFTSTHIVKRSKKITTQKTIALSTKSAADINGKELLVGSSYSALIFDPYSFVIKDTIWKQRTTSVFYRNDTFYIGALDGLYLIKRDKSIQYWGATVPAFKNRIASIKEASDGTIWIATYGDGVLAYKNHRITAHITAENGLTSNICRNIFTDSCSIWVGTDKGLNKIDYTKKDYPVTQYTTADGLASNTINAVFTEGNYVFAGTQEGLTFFDQTKISSNSRCDLRLTGIVVAGTQYPADTLNFSIPHQKNNVQVDFVGISFRSSGDITYRYRLVGLDTIWQSTKETFLSYPTLPSGNYELQLQATNKFGVGSKIVSLPFAIEKLLWEKTWFKLLLAVATAALVWIILSFRIRIIRKQGTEKLKISNRIAELEQLALKSQMNPHFIFNSLNSIQQYVMDKDIAGANKFISGFSRLMRQTLHFSSKQHITLADELEYLATYLELEKNRLEDVFIYKITVNSNIYPADYLISPMILQPFVENSVRHGVRYRKDKSGEISINVSKQDKHLVCAIEDNGIGRKASQQFKGNTAIEYQSKGMSLTNNRIAILNQNNFFKMDVHIDDLQDEDGQGTGTRVTVRFPIVEN